MSAIARSGFRLYLARTTPVQWSSRACRSGERGCSAPRTRRGM